MSDSEMEEPPVSNLSVTVESPSSDSVDEKNGVHVEEDKNSHRDEVSEVASIVLSKPFNNGHVSNEPTHYSNQTSDHEDNREEDATEPFIELDTDDLVVQDECCDEEMGEEELQRVRSKSFSPSCRPSELPVRRRVFSSSPIRYRPSVPVICGESVELEALMHKAQFFLAKSCMENIDIAKEKSLWTTTRSIEKLIGEAFLKAPAVILIFLAKGADHFSGFAKVCSRALYKGQPAIRWRDFNGGGNIRLQWISKRPLDLKATKNIKNPFNKERQVYVGQDGCEIQRAAGQRICSLFPFDAPVDLSVLRRKNEVQKETRKRQYLQPRRKRFRGSSRGTLPSLLDTRVSYNEFKRAKRDLSIEELYEQLRRDELELLLERSLSRRNLLPEMPRSLLYDDLSLSRYSSSSYQRRDRSPIPSLLDGFARLSSRSVPRRLERDLREVRKKDDYVDAGRRKNVPRENGREQERHASNASDSSRRLSVSSKISHHATSSSGRRHPASSSEPRHSLSSSSSHRPVSSTGSRHLTSSGGTRYPVSSSGSRTLTANSKDSRYPSVASSVSRVVSLASNGTKSSKDQKTNRSSKERRSSSSRRDSGHSATAKTGFETSSDKKRVRKIDDNKATKSTARKEDKHRERHGR